MATEIDLPDLPSGEAPSATVRGATGVSTKQTVLAAVVVTAMAAGMGALFAVPASPREPALKDESAPGGLVSAASGLFDMPPIVTNLSTPPDTWVRLEASIIFDAKALPHPEAMAEEIAADELAYLRTVTLAQIEGPIGLQNIRDDLNERAAIRSRGKVTELVIRTLVVQ